MKTCRKCGQSLAFESFHRHVQSKDGLRPRCKSCTNEDERLRFAADPATKLERNRSFQAAHPEKNAARARRWRAENPERSREHGRRWRAANPEKQLAAQRRWSEANHERHLEMGRQWRLANLDKAAEKERQRRVRKLSGAVVDKILIGELFLRDGGICHICKEPVAEQQASVDHLVPLSQGGDHSWVNVSLAHRVCNSRRGAGRLPAQLRLVG